VFKLRFWISKTEEEELGAKRSPILQPDPAPAGLLMRPKRAGKLGGNFRGGRGGRNFEGDSYGCADIMTPPETQQPMLRMQQNMQQSMQSITQIPALPPQQQQSASTQAISSRVALTIDQMYYIDQKEPDPMVIFSLRQHMHWPPDIKTWGQLKQWLLKNPISTLPISHIVEMQTARFDHLEWSKQQQPQLSPRIAGQAHQQLAMSSIPWASMLTGKPILPISQASLTPEQMEYMDQKEPHFPTTFQRQLRIGWPPDVKTWWQVKQWLLQNPDSSLPVSQVEDIQRAQFWDLQRQQEAQQRAPLDLPQQLATPVPQTQAQFRKRKLPVPVESRSFYPSTSSISSLTEGDNDTPKSMQDTPAEELMVKRKRIGEIWRNPVGPVSPIPSSFRQRVESSAAGESSVTMKKESSSDQDAPEESSSDQDAPEESMLEGHSPEQFYHGFKGMNKMGNTRSPGTGNIDPQFSVNKEGEMEGINYAGMPGEDLATQSSKHALQDYQMQIMQLEQQKQKRLDMIQQEIGIKLTETYPPDFHAGALSKPMEQMKLFRGQAQSIGTPGQRNEMPPPSAPVAGRSAPRKRATSTNPGAILVHKPAPSHCEPSDKAANRRYSDFGDLDESFNLNFRTLKTTDVLENFDFDSFLNNGNAGLNDAYVLANKGSGRKRARDEDSTERDGLDEVEALIMKYTISITAEEVAATRP
jgi:hypothetical protein